MNRKKICQAVLPVLLALAFVPLSGCRFGTAYPFYQMEGAYQSRVLYIDGVKYEQHDPRADEDAYRDYSGSSYRYHWSTVSQEAGQQIGVCGSDPDKKHTFNIYEVVGDGEHIFLYTEPAQFYFHGRDDRLWRREGVILDAPSAETVVSVSLVYQGESLLEVDDPAMIAAFMEVYHSEAPQAVDMGNDGDRRSCSLVLYHKDYPFLKYEIKCCCAPEQGTACYQTSAMEEWYPLPDAWCAVISEIDFPAKDE